ncbi:MAG: nuclear transport factor 2 family protein [Candidatus Hodarchaeota archaeon]
MQFNDNELEKEVIKNAILDYYHEGHVKSDPELYNKILHEQWRFFFFDEDEHLRIVNKEEYMSWYDPKNVNENLTWETQFYNIDVSGNIASVKLKIECEEVGYIDYFNLMKINHKWWIVHKLSHKIK